MGDLAILNILWSLITAAAPELHAWAPEVNLLHLKSVCKKCRDQLFLSHSISLAFPTSILSLLAGAAVWEAREKAVAHPPGAAESDPGVALSEGVFPAAQSPGYENDGCSSQPCWEAEEILGYKHDSLCACVTAQLFPGNTQPQTFQSHPQRGGITRMTLNHSLHH